MTETPLSLALQFEAPHFIPGQYFLMGPIISSMSKVKIPSTRIRSESGLFFDDITPFEVECGASDIFMHYYDASGESQVVSMSKMPGIEVVISDGSGAYEKKGELLLEFTYLNSKSGEMEKNPRRMRVNGIAFGRHGGHPDNEKSDFYFVGEDVQYDPKGSGAGQRRFPFWRMGVYGSSEELIPNFLPRQDK